MRKPKRVWLELKKELGRSSNLVWVVALLIWLALSTSRYSHWHSLSHYLLHNTWLSSAAHDTLLTDRLHSQRSASSLSNTLNSGAPLHELNDTHTGITQRTEFIGLQDGIDGHIAYHDDDDGEEANHTESSHQEDALPETPHLYQALDLHTDNDSITVGTIGYLNNSDFEEMANEREVRNESKVAEAARKQSRFEQTRSPDSYGVQNAHVRARPSKSCATVEEMGLFVASPFANSSLQFRKTIEAYFVQHGASYVRELPAKDFCQRGFVFGRAAEDGLGNDIYKLLTAAGLSIMLNRSLIVAEHGSTNPAYFGLAGHVRLPFGDYLRYSNQTFSLSEIKRLWVKHDCAGEYQRPLTMIVDDFQRPTRTKVFCEDWTKWKHPIIWYAC